MNEAQSTVSSELGACEWFVWDLRRSNLIDRGRLDQIVGEFLNRHPGAEPPALSEFLVSEGILTEFQASRLLQGKTQGFVLGPFTLTDALGTGSMGTVYKAVSKTDNREYAVKVLPRRSMWNVRLARRKVRAFEGCKHPSVVPFVDVGTAGGMHYLAWPLVAGQPLEKIVQERGKLPPAEAARYALEAAEGLAACHRTGLFHGLLKASNLMVEANKEIRILDFGIGCLLAETEGESLVDTMSTANSVASGLDCASPESIMDPSNLTPTGDQYSLGCVLYFFLTGQYPFPDGTAVEKMMCHQYKEPTPIQQLNPDVPQGLIDIVERLMKKAPGERYSSTDELIEVLRPWAGGGTPPKKPAARITSPRELRREPAPRPAFAVDTPRPIPRPTPPSIPRIVSPPPPLIPNRKSMEFDLDALAKPNGEAEVYVPPPGAIDDRSVPRSVFSISPLMLMLTFLTLSGAAFVLAKRFLFMHH